MTLLLTLLAALAAAAIYALSAAARRLRIGLLCEIYWGAGIMWAVDMAIAWMRDGSDYAASAAAQAGSDALLGAAVITLGLLIWLAVLLVRRPYGAGRTARNS